MVPLSTNRYNLVQLGAIWHHWLPFVTIADHWWPLGTILYHQVPFSIIENHLVPLGTISYHWVQLNTIRYHWIPSGTIGYHWVPFGTIGQSCKKGCSTVALLPEEKGQKHIYARRNLVKSTIFFDFLKDKVFINLNSTEVSQKNNCFCIK